MATGIEMMLKSLGLGEVIGEMKKLADSGAVEKILAFAEGADMIVERLDNQTQAIEKLSLEIEALRNERSEQRSSERRSSPALLRAPSDDHRRTFGHDPSNGGFAVISNGHAIDAGNSHDADERIDP
jgi:hypothetical protein